MQSNTPYVPNVGLRYDFKETSGTPSCSLFFSDRFDSELSAINGLISPNLIQSYDFDIIDNIMAAKQG